jgi:hypothetical protein
MMDFNEAVWHPLVGLNPWLCTENCGS